MIPTETKGVSNNRHDLHANGRRISSHEKLLPQPAQQQQATKYAKKNLIGNDIEAHKEKPRISMESSRASYSSCSSAFSSFDSNKTAQPEKLINIPENSLHIKTIQEQKPSTQSLDLRDVVKDSMYREARGLSIKSRSCDERKGHAIKRIDSPRPSPQFRPVKSKATGYEGTIHEQLALPRFSYDGRESREKIKSAKELPRFSLDSKASSMKSTIVESRLNFLGRGPLMENRSGKCARNEELGNHNRPSGVVAKLMGLEDFPKEAVFSQSPHLSKGHPPSPSSRLHDVNSVTKATTRSRIPMEPTPWRQQNSSSDSQNLASQSKKETKENPSLSSSVYGEIEKRITKLEFKNSGKDLRALKQILEAMHKTRERVESQTEESAGFISQKRYPLERSSSEPNYSITKKPCPPKQFGSATMIMKPEKVMKKFEVSISTGFPTREISCLQRLQTREPKYLEGSSAHKQEAKDLTLESNNSNQILRGSQQRMVENCTTSGNNFKMVSPRLQNHLILGSSAVKKHLRKELGEKGSINRKNTVKTKNMQLSDDQLSEYSSYLGDSGSVKSESNNSLASQSQMETEVISLANSSRKNGGQKQKSELISREHVPAAELAITVEQPSPVSVLDATFYIEDSPSPVKKISTAFRESPIPDEAEWHLENPNYSTDCKGSNYGFEQNQKLENMKNIMRELRFLNNEPDETAGDNNISVHESHNPDHRYIDKILQTSRILKDANFISKADQHFSSCHLINPEIFHVLEQQQGIVERVDEDLTGKDDRQRLNQKSQRKIVFDVVNEILVCKITSGGLFTVGGKRMSSQRLVNELYLEVDRLHEMQSCNYDEEDDEMIKLLTDDLKYHSEDWEDNSLEVPALVLDIERLIFKDLINEIVTSELVSLNLNDWPKRHCKQLFIK